MSDNYIIEIRSKSRGISVEAGVVVREGHRFRFYAATHAFNSLEGQLFKSLKAAEAAALRHMVERSARGRSTASMSRASESRTQAHTAWRQSAILACEAVSLQLPRSGDAEGSYVAKCYGTLSA